MYKESISQSNSNKKAISSLDTRLTKLEEHTHRIVGLLERLQVLMPPETETVTSTKKPLELFLYPTLKLQVPFHYMTRADSGQGEANQVS